MADPAQASAEFLRSYRLRRGQEASFLSDTQNVTKYTETLSGGGSVEIYDTPGLLDTAGPARDIEHLAEIDKELASLDYVDAVLLVFDGARQQREDDQMKIVLAQLSAVFQPAVYPNIALLFSRLDNDPDLPSMMMIEPFVRGQFGFSSEDVKSRRFFVDNPLHAMVALFNPKAKKETIASVLQRGETGRKRVNDCKRYNNGVEELNLLLQYFASSKSVSRCSNPNFGSFELKKWHIEYLSRVLAHQESAEDALPANCAPALNFYSMIAANDFDLDATISSLSRKFITKSLQVSYDLQSLLRTLNDGSLRKIESFGRLFVQLNFASTLRVVISDIVLHPDSKDQKVIKDFVHIREQFHSDYGKLDSVYRIQDYKVLGKSPSFGKIIDRSSAIISLADDLVTASLTGGESDSIFERLVVESNTFDPCVAHFSESEQDSIVRSANYDSQRIEDLHLDLSLMFANLLRAADIARTVRGLSTAGGDWRSQLLQGSACQEVLHTAQDDMITKAQLILNNLRDWIWPKMCEGALTFAFAKDMEAILEQHASADAAMRALRHLYQTKYQHMSSDDMVDFDIVEEEFEEAPPLLSKNGKVSKVMERIPVVGLFASAVHACKGNVKQARRAGVKNLGSIFELAASAGGAVAGFCVGGPPGAVAGAMAGGGCGAAAARAMEAALAPGVICDTDDLENMAKHDIRDYGLDVVVGMFAGGIGAKGVGFGDLCKAGWKAAFKAGAREGAKGGFKAVGKKYVLHSAGRKFAVRIFRANLDLVAKPNGQ